MEKQKEKPTSVRIPADLLTAIRKLAKEHQRSINGEILWALRHYINLQQKDKEEVNADQ